MTHNPGYSSDGYSVVINAADLMQRAAALKSPAAGGFEARTHLLQSLVPQSAFGTIPGAARAAAALKDVMAQHIDAITAMGVTVSDLAARVEAAAKIAEEAEPVTVKVSRIPEPLQTPEG
jgi:predicted phage gp36 major capsid-like protein